MLKKKKNIKEQEEIEPDRLKQLISDIQAEDYYILDEKNSVVLIEQRDNTNDTCINTMIHYRLENGKLIEMNRWNIDKYHFGIHYNKDTLKELHLCMIQTANGNNDAIYNYNLAKFIVKPGIWNNISIGNQASGIKFQAPQIDYLKEYNGFLACFSLSSTYEDEKDVVSYKNPITQEKIYYSFNIDDGLYFAILNTDGSIRQNKLFKGQNFSRIVQIIDLDEYQSLEEFKQKRVEYLNQLKKQQKEKYYASLYANPQPYFSPYLDREVLKVLKLQKTPNYSNV